MMRSPQDLFPVLISLGAIVPLGNAQGVSDGKNFLLSVQETNGSWSFALGSAPQFLDTVFALRALGDDSASAAGLAWLRARERSTITELAWTIEVLKNARDDVAADATAMCGHQSPDLGWGVEDGFYGDIVHTILAVRALRASQCCSQTDLNEAVSFVLNNQNADGGWGYARGKAWGPDAVYADESLSASNTHVTSLVIETFAQFDINGGTAIERASTWLKALQQPDGGWAAEAATVTTDVVSTSQALRALILTGEQGATIDRGVAYLTNSQRPDGSWNGRVFDTAVAVLALTIYVPPPPCKYALIPGRSVSDTWTVQVGASVFDLIAFYGLDTQGVQAPLTFQIDGAFLQPPDTVGLNFTVSAATFAQAGAYPFQVVLCLYDQAQQVISSATLEECVTLLQTVPSDFDRDGDVDMDDFATFQACVSGPTVPFTVGCATRDLDSDNDVDQVDFGVFQRCYSGTNNLADPSCAD